MSEEEEQIKRILAILHHIKEHGVITIEEVTEICGEDYKDIIKELQCKGIKITHIADCFELDYSRIEPVISEYSDRLKAIKLHEAQQSKDRQALATIIRNVMKDRNKYNARENRNRKMLETISMIATVIGVIIACWECSST